MPAALTYPLAGKTYNWWYESDPEPHMHGRRIYQPRGKVLGGSSCINGMAGGVAGARVTGQDGGGTRQEGITIRQVAPQTTRTAMRGE